MSATRPQALSSAAVFLSDLVGFRPRMLGGVVLLMLVRSFTEGLTFVLLIPLLAFAGFAPSSETGGWARASLIKLQTIGGLTPTLELVLAVFFAIILLRSAVGYASTVLTAQFMAGYVDHVRRRVYTTFSRASWLHFLGSRKAHDTYALTMQVNSVESAAFAIFGLTASLLTILAGLVVAFAVSPPLVIAVLAAMLVLAAPLLIFQRRAYQRGTETVRAMSALYDVLEARMGGLKLAKAFAIERELERDFGIISGSFQRAVVAARENSARATLVQETAAALVLVLFVYASLRIFRASSLESILLIVIFSRLLPLGINFLSGLQSLASALADYDALRTIEARARSAEEALPETIVPIALRSGIVLRDVSFRYPEPSSEWTLYRVSLELPAGKAIGIVGLSGAGKSTLADLIAGLLAPTSGALLIDGAAIDEHSRPHWRASVTYVPQDAPLFHDTIRANLLIGARGASEADTWRCLDLAHAVPLVRGLPLGLETMAGDRGVRLSGGERQRLRIASALLRKPSLLILDEATNALNPVDEREIVAALRNLLGQTTIVMIAHRASPIAWMDQLIVLEGGRVVEVGPPQRVIGQKGSLLSGMQNADAMRSEVFDRHREAGE